jgi:hypothetical protein
MFCESQGAGSQGCRDDIEVLKRESGAVEVFSTFWRAVQEQQAH